MTEREIVTLKEYMDTRLAEMEKRWQVRADLNDKALCSAAEALQARLEQLNAFRQQMLEERALYARREDIDYKLSILQQAASFSKGNTAGKEWTIGVIVAIALAAISLLISLRGP